ncbi:ZrgA family zinc uptake protein, partial [Thalassolituus sp. UBA2107]
MTLKRPVKHAIHNYALFPAVRVSSSVALMVASMLTVMSAGVAAAESHDHHEEHEHHESHDHDEHPDHQESDHQGHDHHGGEHHGAHIHGVGHLNVAVEGSMVTVYLQTPAADIIGFEHVAENKEERTKVAAAHKKLNDASSLFQFTGADCTVVAGSGVEVPQSDSEASDVIAEYTFECED